MTRRRKERSYIKDEQVERVKPIKKLGVYRCPVCNHRVNPQLTYFCGACRTHLEVDYGGINYG